MRRLHKVSEILTNIFIYLTGLLLLVSNIAFSNVAAINGFLKAETSRVINDESAETVDATYYASSFQSVREVKNNGEQINRQIVAEGSVLLKNENSALPLARGSKVSLFSSSSVNPVYAGTGSSGTITSGAVNLKDGLEENGKLTVNPGLWFWYQGKYGNANKNGAMIGVSFSVEDASWDEIDTTAKTNAKFGDAAIFILSRKGGEGADLTLYADDPALTKGNYLLLSPSEIDILQHLKAEKDQGTFQKIIVILNSANPVQCDFVDDSSYGIDAFLWVSDIGAQGAYAVGDILVGDVNPSGHLADTFWKQLWMNPVYANYGDYDYEGTVVGRGAGTTHNNKYVVYQEGIYNGYRYTETRYEDVVMGRMNAGSFSYDDAVAYPFGFGLGYSSFAYSGYNASYDPDTDAFIIRVTVTNTGDISGKEVVQVYLQKPYTEYDIQNGIEKAAVELVGFGKTQLLQPGGKETVQITVAKKEFASYDANNAKTYIVDAGDYYFTAAKNAHDAVNNILSFKGKTVADGMTAEGDASMVSRFTEAERSTTAYAAAITGAKITNQFDNADINKYDGRGDNIVTYISRNNWVGTLKLGYDASYNPTGDYVHLSGTAQMTEDMNRVPEPDNIAYPTYGSTATSYQLIDLLAYEDGTPIEYDSQMWESLLDQLTWDDYVQLLSRGLRMTPSLASISKPQTIDHNGSTGPVQAYSDNPSVNPNRLSLLSDDPDKDERPNIYPSNSLVAATFNTELALLEGEAWGEDCLWAGYAGLYGPGLNLHRSAYAGRCFEYYSEDPILTGKMVVQVSKGMKEKGAYVYLKHCVLYDQDTNGDGISVWANEQTIRELYLRPFQMGIEEGGAECVMSSFNRIGVLWSGAQGFLNHVLRGEFGMTGFAVTDFFTTSKLDGYMTMPYAIVQGQDLPDGDGLMNRKSYLSDYAEGYGSMAWAMRDSAHRLLYTVVHSNAMNGFARTTKVIPVTPMWQTALRVATIVSEILLAGSAVILVVTTVLNEKRKKQTLS